MHFSLATVLAIAPLLAAASPLAKQPLVTIPLSKRSNVYARDGSLNLSALRGQLAASTAKINRGFENFARNTGQRHPSAPPQRKRDVAHVPFTDDSNQLWQGAITVGTPPKQFTIDADTGSSDLFLPALTCGSTCDGHNKYNPKSSSTSKALGKSFSLSYGDGSTVSGKQYKDTVTIGGLAATSQTLGSATKYSSGFESSNFPPDGLMGMGFQSISEYNAPPVFQTLVSEGKTTDSLFAMKLTSSGSELTIGGLNQDLYTGDVTYVPVTQEGYWQINFDALNVDGQQVLGTTSAIVDSGTTLIIGDTDGVSAFYSQIPGSADASQTVGAGFYTFPCDSTLPNVSLTLGGRDFSFTNTLNFGPVSSGSNDCVGGLVADASIGSQFWIAGDVFLNNVYAVFDFGNSQVGFADLA